MIGAKHFDSLRSMYLNANVNRQIYDSTECKIEQGRAKISLVVSEKYFHALDAIHGSVYFKLLDDSAYFAAHSMVDDFFLLTTSFNTNITRPVDNGKITAIGSLRHQSKNLFFAESTLYNQEGKEIAFGSGHFTKSKIALSKNIGYK